MPLKMPRGQKAILLVVVSLGILVIVALVVRLDIITRFNKSSDFPCKSTCLVSLPLWVYRRNPIPPDYPTSKPVLTTPRASIHSNNLDLNRSLHRPLLRLRSLHPASPPPNHPQPNLPHTPQHLFTQKSSWTLEIGIQIRNMGQEKQGREI